MNVKKLDLTVTQAVIHQVAKNYTTLSYHVQLIELLRNILPGINFESYSKYDLHKILNRLLIEKYEGEEILKYKLFELYAKRRGIVAAFEIKVNTSRIDFLAVNGHTFGFEIKSALDNFSKLEKQMTDYDLAFEYNFLVVDERHLERASNVLPEKWGLLSYRNGKYIKRKKAALNGNIDAEVQLSLLTKSELRRFFADESGSIKNIVRRRKGEYVNEKFKQALKERYRNRWEFLKIHHTSILPIDVQFFFNNNIEPRVIYHH